jgi:CHASE2 domain-containing sensor protein
MAKIFISYRRGDAWEAAQLVRERLAHWFSPDEVFMDVTGIEGGEPWRRELDERLDWADTVVVVIGKLWLGELGRRQSQPEDWVRWEIAEALRRAKRVIPLLVDGANPLTADQLPQPLKPLAELQALPLSNARLEKDIEALVEAIGRRRLADRLREAELSRRVARAAPFLVPAVTLAVLFLAWVSLFDLLRLDSFVANATMMLGDVIAPKQPSSQLLLVAKEHDEERALDGSARADNAALIDALSQLGAKRVAFDVFFRRSTPHDNALLNAVRAAGKRGTQVVFGFNEIQDGRPLTFPGLAEAGAALGSVCIARRIGLATLGFLTVDRGGLLLPALALVSAFGPIELEQVRTDVAKVDLAAAGRTRLSIPYSYLESIREGRSECPALMEGDVGAALLFPLSARERLRDPAFQKSAADVLARRVFPDPEFKDKIVLVGVRHPQDKVITRMDGGSARFGYEFHADAVSAILEDRAVSSLGMWAQWGLMLVMAALAVALRLWRAEVMARSRIWLALGLVLAYLGIAVLVYVLWLVLINAVYQLVAFVLTYWAYGLLERRWRHA